jgi:nucleoporin POM152
MNSTPRRGPGGFPATPQQRGNRSPNTPSTSTPNRPNVKSPLPDVPRPDASSSSSSGPLIPYDILDAAQQRFYVFAFYVALQAYKTYDFYTLVVEEDQSLALCLKWVFLDMCTIYGIPLLEIPWLEWSNGAAFLLFALHAGLDWMLMFRIGLPLTHWLVSLAGFLWDTETAINERSVKPGPILFNASLILGKQIINILPEGYVHQSTPLNSADFADLPS